MHLTFTYKQSQKIDMNESSTAPRKCNFASTRALTISPIPPYRYVNSWSLMFHKQLMLSEFALEMNMLWPMMHAQHSQCHNNLSIPFLSLHGILSCNGFQIRTSTKF